MLRVWLLNLDADLELSRPVGYAPPHRVLERVTVLTRRVQPLLAPGDVTLGQLLKQGSAAAGAAGGSMRGIAWCPTPRAQRLLAEAGAPVRSAPSLQVLQQVNQRAFCAGLGQTLPGAAYVTSRAELDEVLASRPADSTGPWLLKRPFSASGSGQRRVRVPDDSDEAWLSASLARGGLQVEPFVERLLDLSMHGYLDEAGSCSYGEPIEQVCDARGQWQQCRRLAAGSLSAAERGQLRGEMERVAGALSDAGYFGPFGVDAFRYRYGGEVRFNGRCEINARYTMGWALGMADTRPDWA